MQKMEDQIKGLEYLSDDAKKRVLEARGIETPEPSPRAQHKIEREDARKAEEQTFIEKSLTARPPTVSTMKLHIDINLYGANGNAFHIEGDVFSQDDLAEIHKQFRDYMPRRKLWGIF